MAPIVSTANALRWFDQRSQRNRASSTEARATNLMHSQWSRGTASYGISFNPTAGVSRPAVACFSLHAIDVRRYLRRYPSVGVVRLGIADSVLSDSDHSFRI